MLNDGKIGHDQTVAVLYRTNAQSRYLEEACVQQNLPYVIRGGAGGFYKRAEVKDCLCFLRWLHNGNDEGAMLRAIKTPSRGIGDKALVEFREYCTEVNSYHQEHFPEIKRLTPLDILISMTDDESGSSYILAEGAPEASVFISKRALNNFLPFSRQMREIRHRAHSIPVEKLLFMIIEELDLVNHFDSISKSKSEFEERRENVQELRKATKRYSHYGAALKVQDNEDNDEFGSESALGMFLDDVALVTDIAGVSEQGDNRLVVSLMTIHASKGTEFDVVFVVGNEEGTLPGNRALQEGEGSVELEEEKRLCYVAMTRAKTQLVMTWRKQVTSFSNWSDDGSRMKQTDRSRFLDALISKKSRSKGLATKQPKKTTDRDVGQILRQQRRGAKSATEFQKRRPPQPSRSQPSKSYSSAASPRKTNGSLDAKRVNIDMSNPKRPEINANGYNTDMPIRPKKSPPVNGGAGPRMIRPRETEDYSPRTKPSATGFNGNAPERVSRDNGRSKPTKPFISGDKNLASRTKPTNERPEFDSTWFFPVGSTVVHGNFGKGVVLQPPPAGKSKNLLVRVQFENGRTMEFPAKGTDIVPDFLT